jgi:hypothetical protein
MLCVCVSYLTNKKEKESAAIAVSFDVLEFCLPLHNSQERKKKVSPYIFLLKVPDGYVCN